MEAKAELLGECAKLTVEDIFQEFPVIWDRKYTVSIEGISHECSNEIKRTARFAGTVHARDEFDDLVSHKMMISVAGLIQWARYILCPHDLDEIPFAVAAVFHAVCEHEPLLQSFLVFDCQYRNGICTRPEPCGEHAKVVQAMIAKVPEKVYRELRNKAVIDRVISDAGLSN